MKNELINSKILIVDDSFETLSFLGKLLNELSFVVFPASSGEQAIALAKSKKPELVLLDVNMPGKNGFEVCIELKNDSVTKDIPVIFLTGKTESTDIVKGLEVGAVDYIQKPFNKAELISRISTHLGMVKLREKMLESQSMLHLKEMELLQKEKEKAICELEYKSKELISLTIQLTKHSNSSDKFISELNAEVNNFEPSYQQKLNSLICSYRAQLEIDNWCEIEKLFLQLHGSFFANLLATYKNLTKNELHLCAFLRLNLSIKDIASITLQSEDTIKKARYRLRCKLNISSDKNLHSQIMKF